MGKKLNKLAMSIFTAGATEETESHIVGNAFCRCAWCKEELDRAARMAEAHRTAARNMFADVEWQCPGCNFVNRPAASICIRCERVPQEYGHE